MTRGADVLLDAVGVRLTPWQAGVVQAVASAHAAGLRVSASVPRRHGLSQALAALGRR